MYTYFEGMNGVKRLATKGYKILLTTDKTRKKLPTSDKKLPTSYHCISVFTNQRVHKHGKQRNRIFQKLAQIFVGLHLKIFKPREFYSVDIFAVLVMSRQSYYVYI